MKNYPFEVGDKVVLAYAGGVLMATVPKLEVDKVYCVRNVTVSKPNSMFPAHQRLHLCGVRLSRRLRDPEGGLPFTAFRRVGCQRKEEA